MRIVHFGPAIFPPVLAPFGGAIQRRIWELAWRQAGRGHEVVVYSIGDRRETRVERGVRLEYLPPRLDPPLRQLEFQWTAMRHLRRGGRPVDLLHAHSQPEGAVLAPRLVRTTILSFDEYHFRGGRSTPLYHLYRRYLGAFDRLLPVSEYCLTESAAYWRLRPERMQVLHNGVNLEQFQPDAAAGAVERARLPGDGPVVLYVGRLNRQKGTHVLLEAAKLLRARGAAVRVVVAGPRGQFDGPGTEPDWAAELEREGVTYLGAVPEERLPGVYNMCDAFVMPTTTLEMFGMAVVEAQACGKPVVATDHGGLRETVPDSAGIRVPPSDAPALADAIERLAGDAALRGRLAAGARTNAARFDWDLICDRIEELVGDGRRAARTGRVASPAGASR